MSCVEGVEWKRKLRRRAAELLAIITGRDQERLIQPGLQLFEEDSAEGEQLSIMDTEALLCLSLVKELEMEQWKPPLDEYCRLAKEEGTAATAEEVESRFYSCLFAAMPAEEWMPVVRCFQQFKENPLPALVNLGRRSTPAPAEVMAAADLSR